MSIQNIYSIEHNPHYVNRYLKFIRSIQENGEKNLEYNECHHILPRSIFPEFSKLNDHPWNRIILTYREHFIAHLILSKCFFNRNKAKMIRAFYCMFKNTKKYQKVFKNSKYYDEKRTTWYKSCRGQNSSWFNRKHSEESKRKMSITKSSMYNGESNPFFGKTHSNETKKKISNALKGRITKGMSGLKHSEESKRKMSLSRKKYLKIKEQ